MDYKIELVLLVIVIIIAFLFYYYKISNNNNNIFNQNIYLDNNGTTEMTQDVLNEYVKSSKLGNPSSSYATEAKNLVGKSDDLILNWLNVKNKENYKIIYTSGGTESNNTIFNILKSNELFKTKPHVITTSYEHNSVLECVKKLQQDNIIELTLVDPDMYGIVNPESIVNAIKYNTVLVSVMFINNEIGSVNNIYQICNAVKNVNKNIIFHTDAVQAFGKFSIQMEPEIDAISVSFHKFNGPTGLGALIITNDLLVKIKQYPLLFGSQNYGARGGTVNISAIGAGYKALKNTINQRKNKNINLYNMKNYILTQLSKHYNIGDYKDYVNKPDTFAVSFNNNSLIKNEKNKYEVVLLGPLNSEQSSPNTLLLSIVKYGDLKDHFCNVKLKQDLLNDKVIISIGSACNSSNNKPSHVLHSIKAPYIIRCGVIRISLGDFNSFSEIKKFCNILIANINKQ